MQQKKAGMMWALPGIEELKERQESGSQVRLHGLKLPSLFILLQFTRECSVSFCRECHVIWAASWQKPTEWSVRPAKTQFSLGIHPVWSESSLCAKWEAQNPKFLKQTAKTLIRLGECPGWSESSLGAQVILLVLSAAPLMFHENAYGLVFNFNQSVSLFSLLENTHFKRMLFVK